jgi:hypothetical protein
VSFGLSIAPQNRRREVDVGHASKSSGLLHVEASLARIFQSDIKTGGGDSGWCTWHYHRGYVGGKLKTGRSMRRVTSNPDTLSLPFSMY